MNDYNTKNGEHNTQRNTSYRAMIPFYILFDLDMNANHIRMYGQIEQMESNPDPRINPSFSYQWLADQLGINKRNTINMASLLIEKKYIEHVQNAQGKWFWRTVKAQVECIYTECTSITSVAQRHPPVSPSDTPPVSPSDTQRSQKIISQNISVCGDETKQEPEPTHTPFFEDYKKQELTSLTLISDNSKKITMETEARQDPKAIQLFATKFTGRDITIDELFKACQEHYGQKNLIVGTQRFIQWIKRENPEHHQKIGSIQQLQSVKRVSIFTEEEQTILADYRHALKINQVKSFFPNQDKLKIAEELLRRDAEFNAPKEMTKRQ